MMMMSLFIFVQRGRWRKREREEEKYFNIRSSRFSADCKTPRRSFRTYSREYIYFVQAS